MISKIRRLVGLSCVMEFPATCGVMISRSQSQRGLFSGSGSVSVSDHLSIIATVGRGMVHNCGTAARLFSAMSRARINVRMIDQGSSELSIIVGVNDSDFEATIHAIYHEFVG